MAKPANFISTLTEVANLALEDIGEAPKDFLTDPVFDDNTGLIAEVCLRHMYVVIREAQTDFTWDALFRNVVLTTPEDLTDNDAYVWGYRYALPDDFLRFPFDLSFDYEIEGDWIYCGNSEEIRIKYHSYSEDPSAWPATLLSVVRAKLGIAICMPVTENEGKLTRLITLFEQLTLPRAKYTDARGKQQPRGRLRHMRYTRARGRPSRFGPDDRRQY